MVQLYLDACANLQQKPKKVVRRSSWFNYTIDVCTHFPHFKGSMMKQSNDHMIGPIAALHLHFSSRFAFHFAWDHNTHLFQGQRLQHGVISLIM